MKADKALAARIRENTKKLVKLRFTVGGLIAVPARTAQELIDEGRALNHCVGTYAQRVAEGQTIILFIRHADDPGTPFFTMEVRNNAVFQCRGLKNCDMTQEVKAFVEAFKTAKLTPKQKRQRTQYVAAMA